MLHLTYQKKDIDATSCDALSIEVCFGILGFVAELRHLHSFVLQVFKYND